jgi:hypothetical protein
VNKFWSEPILFLIQIGDSINGLGLLMNFPIILTSFFEQHASDTGELFIDAKVVGLVIGSIDGHFERI